MVERLKDWVRPYIPVDEWMTVFAFEFVFAVLFLLVIFFISRYREKRFWARVEAREEALAPIGMSTCKTVPATAQAGLVYASIVVGQGHYRRFVAGFIKLVGGELKAYADLNERARREAVNRMKEEAKILGATKIVNVRFTTSSLMSLNNKGGRHATEITASGTAVISE